MSNDDRFADAPISRRRFFQLSGAVGASLALPGNATADADSRAFTAEYRYVLNHTPDDYAVPTLVRFSDPSGPAAMDSALDVDVHTTREPEPAAYAQLTTVQAGTVEELPTASEFQFSPGSNPFWRIGYYPLGVFPEPRRSVDYIGFEQLKDGLGVLEDRYPDRIRVKNVGHSPGHFNNATDRPDPKGMYVVELTNFDSDTDFEDKEKVFYSCSLHGLEMAARETAARVLENVARGSEPDVIEDEEKIEPYLDDVVVIMGFTNPDGWVARNPQYDSNYQLNGPDVPAAPLYERGNAEVFDTNRQYPIEGYLKPSHFPAQPNDPVSETEETPDYVNEKVPDAKAFIDFFSTYENLNYGADLHGGPVFNDFVLGLISQDEFDTRELHEVYEMCLNIDDVLEEALEIWTTAGDLNEQLFMGDPFTVPDGVSGNFGFVPTSGFDYATIYDTIDYTVSGAFLDWMAHPEPIGLDLTTLDFEMSFNHLAGGNVYNPELFRMEVDGYRVVIRTITAFAVNNSDTPTTDEEFSTRTESDGEDVAYVTTGDVRSTEDALLATSEDLVFLEYSEITTNTYSGVVGPGIPQARMESTHTFTAPADADRITATASWNANSTQDNELYLRDSDGNTVASSTNFNPIAGGERIRAGINGGEEYTLVIETYANVASQYTIEATLEGGSTRGTGDGDTDDGSDTDTASLSRTTETVTVDGVTEQTFEVSGTDLHSMGVDVRFDRLVADAELVAPDGEVVAEYAGVHEDDDRLGGKDGGVPEFVVSDPQEGTWTFRLNGRLQQAKEGQLMFWTLSSSSPNPSPDSVFGYTQRDYAVTPFQFFEDYGEFIEDGGTVTPVTVDEVAGGALTDDEGNPAFDHVVAIHAYGANGDTQAGNGEYGYRAADHPDPGFTTEDYTDGLDDFVDAGGNLVLTDTGLKLLPKLDNGLLDGSAMGEDAVTSASNYEVARFTSKNLDHPLLTDARPIQNQLWKTAPLGYQAFNGAPGQAPMFAVDESALAAAAGDTGVATVAGSNREGVVAASVTGSEDSGTGVHLVGSLLPRATQSNVHAFGLQDYTVTFLGNLIMTSALGFTQIRNAGDTRRTYGRGDEWDLEGVEPVEPPAPDFSASGSRSDDGQVFTGGQTNRVEITVTSIDGDIASDTPVTITDVLPEGWTTDTAFGDAEDFDENGNNVVELTSVTPADVEGDATVTRTYYAEAPSGPGETGQDTFGPAEATAEIGDETVTAQIAGTKNVVLVGPSTSL